jgi:molybdenum cofactor biosynthesis enzyme MoaA
MIRFSPTVFQMSVIELSGVHILLTYKCLYECDHCFVWSSPGSRGTMTPANLEKIIRQAHEIPSVKWIYFEGGEPFLFYPLLLRGAALARKLSFEVGVVTNAYFATDDDAAEIWLRPLADLGISDLSLSSDVFHGTGEERKIVRRGMRAAKRLGIPVGIIEIENIEQLSGSAPRDESAGQLCFRGRAASTLADKVEKKAWRTLDTCPEKPPQIGRVHVDPYGNVLFCQGVSIGNAWKKPLKTIISELEPQKHPIIGPLMKAGPVALAEEFDIAPRKAYADACHMCYEVRCALRKKGRLKSVLVPDQLYGTAAQSSAQSDSSRRASKSTKSRQR